MHRGCNVKVVQGHDARDGGRKVGAHCLGMDRAGFRGNDELDRRSFERINERIDQRSGATRKPNLGPCHVRIDNQGIRLPLCKVGVNGPPVISCDSMVPRKLKRTMLPVLEKSLSIET